MDDGIPLRCDAWISFVFFFHLKIFEQNSVKTRLARSVMLEITGCTQFSGDLFDRYVYT